MIKFMGNTFNVEEWYGQPLAPVVALDTETTIAPFYSTPQIVLGSVYDGNGDTVYVLGRDKLKAFMEAARSVTLIFHNAPFDIDVIEKELSAPRLFLGHFQDNRIMDTSMLYRLYGLATDGWVPRRYNLNLISTELLEESLDKAGEERITFEQYLNTPLNEVPPSYLDYACRDALATFYVYEKLRNLISDHDTKGTLLSQHIQVKGDLALNRIYKKGIGFDIKRRDRWLRAAQKRLNVYRDRLATWGWVRGVKGNQAILETILKRFGVNALTESGKLSTSGKDLEPYRHHQFVDDYLKFNELETQTMFVRDFEEERIHPKYDSLKNTGRTGCSKPNIQNLPRSGAIRSMYRAKPGHTFIITDYTHIELNCLAQVCINKFGYSQLGDTINNDICPHYDTASAVYNKPIKDVTKSERQFAKIPNFAYPTNMKPETFLDYAKGYGIECTLDEAAKTKSAWVKKYPEMKEFWKLPEYGATDHVGLTGRKRAKCFYTAYLNSWFQGLAADGIKLAMFNLIYKLGYDVVAMVHDELVVEVPIEEVEMRKAMIEKTMIEGMREVVPDVKIKVESEVNRRYKK